MQTDVMFSSNTDQWATPKSFFEELNKEFHFNLDPCADDNNHKCDTYFTASIDGLSQNWGGTESFVIHLTEGLSTSGLRRHTRKGTRKTRLFVC